MKKIVTLLLGIIAISSVFAQSQDDKRRAKDKVFGGSQYPTNNPNYPSTYPNNYPNTYPGNYPNNSAQAEIDQINRDYDARIYSVQNNPNLSPAEKDRQIRQLNDERRRRIQNVYNRNGGYNNNGKNKRKHKDHDDDDDDRYEHRNGNGNNGKHLGWEKGKGNPHKNGNWKD